MSQGNSDGKVKTGLAERLTALEVTNTAVSPVDRLLNELAPTEAEVLRRLLDNDAVSTSSIHRELRAAGYSIARDSLAAYRKGTR